MRQNGKFILAIVALICFIVAAFLGVKIIKKIRHMQSTPKRYDARKAVEAMPALPTDKDIQVFVASSLDRIFQDGYTALKPTFTTAASLSAAGHEYESFQVVVKPQAKDIVGLTLRTSDLVNKTNGSIIPKANVTWRVVKYVETLQPYYPVKFIGLWPDPLVPEVSYDVKVGMVQPFWVTVYVPPQTPAGEYAGTVTVRAQGMAPYSIPVKLRVYNFTLPRESHLKTAFDFYDHMTKIRFPQGEKENEVAWGARLNDLNNQFIEEMLRHRMNPILNVDPSSQEELARVDHYLVLGLNNFSIGKRSGTFNNNWPKDDESIEGLFDTYRGYGENLKLNDMLQYNYIYMWDEGDMGNPVVPKIASMIHRAYPGLKTMVCYHGLWDTKALPNWGKDIDIWTFQIDDYDEEKFKDLQQRGIEMWMYISGPAGTTSPNLALDFDSIDYRIIPWICWKFDIKGFLYWCVNWWPTVDPYKNARNSQWAQNGNGLLFYPGKDEPVASLRIEIFRDGMEDYEYIQTLIGKLRTLKQKGLDGKYQDYFKKSIELMTMDNAIVESMTKFTRDGEYLKSRRNAIAEQIEAFNTLQIP